MGSNIGKLFAGIKGPMKSEDSGSDGSEGDDPGLTSAQAILKAIKADNASQLDLALADHYKTCQGEPEPDEGDDGSEG